MEIVCRQVYDERLAPKPTVGQEHNIMRDQRTKSCKRQFQARYGLKRPTNTVMRTLET